MGTVQGPYYSYAQLEGLWINNGGDPSQAAMAAAIAMAESGGGANSVNGNTDGSTDRGLWQINSVHGSQSTYDVQANVQAAISISSNGSNWQPWSTYNDGSYKQYFNSGVAPQGSGTGGASSGGGGGGGSSSAPLPGASPATTNPTAGLSMTDLEQQYGFTAAMLNADSSLKTLFTDAVAGGWTTSKFQAELMNTSWWRSQTDTARAYWIKKFTDPATAAAEYQTKQADVNVIASEFGINMFDDAHERHLIDVATNAVINKNWDDAQLRNFFASNIGNLPAGGEYGGKLGQEQDQIVTTGYKNGVRTPNSYLTTWIRKIALGQASMEQVQHDIRMKAANIWTAYKDQLMSGQDMMDIASPFIKSASTLLELPDSEFNLFNPLIRNNLQWKDPQASGKPPSATPLWQFETTVRNDPRWLKTNNARDAVSTDMHKILGDFGLVF